MGHTEQISGCQVLKNQYLLSSSFDATIKVWDLKNGTLLKNYKHIHKTHISTFTLLNNLFQFISGSSDKTLRRSLLVIREFSQLSRTPSINLN